MLRGEQAGARFMLDALSQALFTLMLRAHLGTLGQDSGTLALLADKRLGSAWQAMLADPAHDWTIERLSDMASMSRSTFMRTFEKVAGESPWVLLTKVRMELAFSLLSHSHLGLNDIAAQVVISPRRRLVRNSRKCMARWRGGFESVFRCNSISFLRPASPFIQGFES